MRDKNMICEVVEYWNYFAKRRHDFLGNIDILCFKAGDKGVVGIQATSSSNIVDRLKKMARPEIREWLLAGNQLLLHIWYKGKKPGTRVAIWKLRDKQIKLADLMAYFN